jgi:N-acetylneuraminate synthase
MDRAKELIQLARLSGADYVKFQKRNPHESVPEDMKHEPHPNARFAYGETYLEHRLALELDLQQHQELKIFCEEAGIGYASSVWDIPSAREIASLSPDYIKIPSACNMDEPLITALATEYSGDIHISTGMILPGEKLELFALIVALDIQDRTVIYHCTSEYPCPFERLCLLELERLRKSPIKAAGFSNHGYGIAADIVAYMLGSSWIERHFVDDRTFPHTDAAASLEPDGLRRLCRDLKAVRKTLKYKDVISDEELKQRKKLRGTDD